MDEDLDPAILAALQRGSKIIAVNPHGKGSWSAGYKVEIENDGKESRYFLKLARGEFESQKELLRYLPENTAVPLARGRLETDSSASFFLTPFRNLSDEKTAEPSQLVEVLARLHISSASTSSKFGFHVPTFNGIVPLVNDWCDTWEEYFARQLRSDMAWHQSIRGADPDMDVIAAEFFEKVIPRLLRPLQTGGKSIQPVLVHGDVWPGNVQIDKDAQSVVLFDACCCYGHNELDLGMMREPRYRFTAEHISKYLEVIRPSEPEGDFDDRNAIYAMRDNIIKSGLHDHRAFLWDKVKEEMQRLTAKHPHGLDGFEG